MSSETSSSSETGRSSATYKCGKCGAIFNNRDNLHAHWENCAGGDDQNPDNEPGKFTCGMCGQVFKTSLALGAHALRVHAGGNE